MSSRKPSLSGAKKAQRAQQEGRKEDRIETNCDSQLYGWPERLPAWAQDGLREHWSGAVETPDHPTAMEVDLDRGPNGNGPNDWISFTSGKRTFHLKGAPGDPTFAGTLPLTEGP